MYNFTVVAEDNGLEIRRTGTSQITLLLVDNTNDHSPVLDMSTYVVNVSEDTSPGTTILTVIATDEDDPASPAGQIANFTLIGTQSANFRIVQDASNSSIGYLILK